MNGIVAAKWLRRLEIALAGAGICLVGAAFAATLHRWQYQARQERAFVRTSPPNPAAPHLPGDAPAANGRSRAFAPDPLVLGAIEIPRLGIRAIVRDGDDDATLAVAVGHVQGTARPGQIGNTVLAAHRDTFFRELRDVRLNDAIRLLAPPQEYAYRVTSIEIIAPTETRVLDPTADEVLTLVTCYPFHYVGEAPSRFIVRATRTR